MNVSLNLRSCDGKLYAEMSAELGAIDTSPPHMKPSRVRRHRRRCGAQHLSKQDTKKSNPDNTTDQSHMEGTPSEPTADESNSPKTLNMDESVKDNVAIVVDGYEPSNIECLNNGAASALSLMPEVTLTKSASTHTFTAQKDDEITRVECCYHECRPNWPPEDGNGCCRHRCRPTWTREQRMKLYGEKL